MIDYALHPMEEEEKHIAFVKLQQRFTSYYNEIFCNNLAEKTVIIVPSLSLDSDMLGTIKGVAHYEERMLCMLMLLRMPKTHIIYLSSIPIDSTIIDYYLHMLPGITVYHAAQRLTLLSCYDASGIPLTKKILARPRLMKRILEHVKDTAMCHISCFNVTEYEKELAIQLNIPVYGTDPALAGLGSKSGARQLFKQLNIDIPNGIEYVKNRQAIIETLAMLKKNNPALKRAVIKMNEGFSGEGNAVFSYRDINANEEDIKDKISAQLETNCKLVAEHLSFGSYINKFETMGGVVEEFIEGDLKESPSVQCRINPMGKIDIISTHDQLLGGDDEQIFLGATFPANNEYSVTIAHTALQVTEALRSAGAIGRLGIDFLSVKTKEGWKHYAIEINLRKGGTTHPFLMLQFLTAGEYYWQEGNYKTYNGGTRCYFATDNLYNEKYKGLTPHDLIDIAICNNLIYDEGNQSGVMFHMIGALSQYGKLGLVCIAADIDKAKDLYKKTLDVLEKECPG